MPAQVLAETADSQLVAQASTLDALQRGRCATIVDVEGDDGISRRLRELGFLPGVEVEMIGSAPLRDPLAVFLRGSRIALRRRDARRILVSVAAATQVGVVAAT